MTEICDIIPTANNALVVYKRRHSGIADDVTGNLFGKISSSHLNRNPTMNTISNVEHQYKNNVITLRNVRVRRVFVPKTYDTLCRTCSIPIVNNNFFVFQSIDHGSRIFRGRFTPLLDCLHSYDIDCIWQEKHQYNDTKKQKLVVDYRSSYQIVSIRPTSKMFKFSLRPILYQMIDIVFKDRNQLDEYKNIMSVISRWNYQTYPGKTMCIKVIKAFGNTEWYHTLETHVSWAFKEWYLNELCPPYDRKALCALNCDTIFTLIRIVITDPWKLCFSCRYDIPDTTQDLSPPMLKMLIDNIGISNQQIEVELIFQTEQSPIFKTMHDSSESYILYKDFELAFPQQDQRNLLISKDIIKVVSECSPTSHNIQDHVYLTNDYNIEKELAETISNITSTLRVDRTIVLPLEQRMWVKTLTLNKEQQIAVDNALKSRFYLVCGKPGSGKTSAVLKAIKGSYADGQCIAAAFTGMASVHLKNTIGVGVTIHSIIESAFRYQRSDDNKKPFKYQDASVLILDEFSQVSSKLLLTLLNQLPWITRIVFVGDYRQKYPPGGGASVIAALYRRCIGDIGLACDLQFSVRVQSGASALLHNLDAICAYNDGNHIPIDQFPKPSLMLEWSSNILDVDHSFFFLHCKSSSVTDIVHTITHALTYNGMIGIDTIGTFAIIVHTNNLRKKIEEKWFWMNSKYASLFTGKPYPYQTFCVGERIMFLQNANKWKHENGLYSDDVSNGMIGCIHEIFDILDNDGHLLFDKQLEDDIDDVVYSRNVTIQSTSKTNVQHTNTPKRSNCPLLKRWLSVKLDTGNMVTICADDYNLSNICRIPPATIAKFQGQEVETIVIVLDQQYNSFSRRDIYTACSRASRRCIIVTTDLIESKSNDIVRECPSQIFKTIVSKTPLFPEKTIFYSRFTFL